MENDLYLKNNEPKRRSLRLTELDSKWSRDPNVKDKTANFWKKM
jgi:hypothetical protein